MSEAPPKIWVQVQIVYPKELGGQIVTKQTTASLDEWIPDHGEGIEAIVLKTAGDALDAVKE